jgi:glycolate oxidase iron-sulfur subunit
MATHFDRCLGCMACVTACPSGVQYDKLIEATRPQVERNYHRSWKERLFRRLVFATFTHPGRVRALVPLLSASRRTGLRHAARGNGLLKRFPRLRALEKLAPAVSLSAATSRLSTFTPALGERRGRVGLLQGCVQRVFFNDVNAATARALSAEGFDVFAPRKPRCCGALMLHSGYEDQALKLARSTIAAFEDCDFVAVTAAGCGSAMKDYAHLLSDDPEWKERARAFSDKVRDASELAAAVDHVAPRHPVRMKVAYHDSCHLAHAQGIRAEPRSLLREIPGVDVLEPAEWEICCGSAGIYNLIQTEAADELGRRKAANLLATGADAIAAGNPGCALQIAAYIEEAGRPLPIYHPMELLDRSIRGPETSNEGGSDD